MSVGFFIFFFRRFLVDGRVLDLYVKERRLGGRFVMDKWFFS